MKKQKLDELIKKWEKSGFLNNAKNKRNLALACEFSKIYLIDEDGEIVGLIYPVLVRLFSGIEENLSTQQLFNKVIEIIKAFSEILNRIEKTDEWVNRESRERDIELEIIEMFFEEYDDVCSQSCG